MVTKKSSLGSWGLHPAIRASFCLLDRGGEEEALSETRQAFEVAAALRILLSYKISIILKLKGHTKGGWSRESKFLIKSIERFQNYSLICLRRPKCLQERAPQYILIKSFFLHRSLSLTFLRQIKFHFKSASFSIDDGRTWTIKLFMIRQPKLRRVIRCTQHFGLLKQISE